MAVMIWGLKCLKHNEMTPINDVPTLNDDVTN